MLTASLGNILDVTEGSIGYGVGSLTDLFGTGSSAVSTFVAGLIETLATASGAGA